MMKNSQGIEGTLHLLYLELATRIYRILLVTKASSIDSDADTLFDDIKSSINHWCGELTHNPEYISGLDDLIPSVQRNAKEVYLRIWISAWNRRLRGILLARHYCHEKHDQALSAQ